MENPAFVGALVSGLAVLLGLGIAWKKFSGSSEPRSISPQPLVVKAEREYAEKKELDALRVELIGRLADHERRNESDMGLIRTDLALLRRGNEYVQRRVNGMAHTLYSIAGKLGIVQALGEPGDEG